MSSDTNVHYTPYARNPYVQNGTYMYVTIAKAADIEVKLLGVPILTGPLVNNKYIVDIPAHHRNDTAFSASAKAATGLTVQERCDLIHRRTGYTHPTTVMKANELSKGKLGLPSGVTLADFKLEDCDPYHLGTMHKTPHRMRKGDTKRPKKPFSAIAIDIEKMETESYGGAKYSLKVGDLYRRGFM